MAGRRRKSAATNRPGELCRLAGGARRIFCRSNSGGRGLGPCFVIHYRLVRSPADPKVPVTATRDGSQPVSPRDLNRVAFGSITSGWSEAEPQDNSEQFTFRACDGCHPLRGLAVWLLITWGFASLHPRLYACARFAGSNPHPPTQPLSTNTALIHQRSRYPPAQPLSFAAARDFVAVFFLAGGVTAFEPVTAGLRSASQR